MPKTKRQRRVSGRRRKATTKSSAVPDTVTSSKASDLADEDGGRQSPSRALSPPSGRATSSGEMTQLASEFRKLCSAHANRANAAAMAKYMRNQFAFFGIKTPERRQLQNEFTKKHKDKLTHHSTLLQFVNSLWEQEERECQAYGVDLMNQFRGNTLGETEQEYEEAVVCVETLITTKSWWDTVDMLASHSEYVQQCQSWIVPSLWYPPRR